MTRREPQGDPDEQIIRDLEQQLEEGTLLDDNVPLRPTSTSRSRRAVFSVRLGQEELQLISQAAERRGSSIGDFIRDVAVESAGRELAPDEELAYIQKLVGDAKRALDRKLAEDRKERAS